MTATQAIEQLIHDIQTLRNASGGSVVIRRQQLAFEYLSANNQLITDFIDETYLKHSDEEREALLSKDSTLNGSAADADFRKLALSFRSQLELAEFMRKPIDDDMLHMLVRGLRFALHFEHSDGERTILYSPIAPDTEV